jgi:hypothetical protein
MGWGAQEFRTPFGAPHNAQNELHAGLHWPGCIAPGFAEAGWLESDLVSLMVKLAASRRIDKAQFAIAGGRYASTAPEIAMRG